jgi:hypothetical protein
MTKIYSSTGYIDVDPLGSSGSCLLVSSGNLRNYVSGFQNSGNLTVFTAGSLLAPGASGILGSFNNPLVFSSGNLVGNFGNGLTTSSYLTVPTTTNSLFVSGIGNNFITTNNPLAISAGNLINQIGGSTVASGYLTVSSQNSLFTAGMGNNFGTVNNPLTISTGNLSHCFSENALIKNSITVGTANNMVSSGHYNTKGTFNNSLKISTGMGGYGFGESLTDSRHIVLNATNNLFTKGIGSTIGSIALTSSSNFINMTGAASVANYGAHCGLLTTGSIGSAVGFFPMPDHRQASVWNPGAGKSVGFGYDAGYRITDEIVGVDLFRAGFNFDKIKTELNALAPTILTAASRSYSSSTVSNGNTYHLTLIVNLTVNNSIEGEIVVLGDQNNIFKQIFKQ